MLGKDSLALETGVRPGGLTMPLIFCSVAARQWFQASCSVFVSERKEIRGTCEKWNCS